MKLFFAISLFIFLAQVSLADTEQSLVDPSYKNYENPYANQSKKALLAQLNLATKQLSYISACMQAEFDTVDQTQSVSPQQKRFMVSSDAKRLKLTIEIIQINVALSAMHADSEKSE